MYITFQGAHDMCTYQLKKHHELNFRLMSDQSSSLLFSLVFFIDYLFFAGIINFQVASDFDFKSSKLTRVTEEEGA